MATLIDKTYFLTGLTGIPNSNATGAGACIGANIQAYIDIYEPEFLKKLLGDDLYDAYVLAPDEDRFVALIAELGILALAFSRYLDIVVRHCTSPPILLRSLRI